MIRRNVIVWGLGLVAVAVVTAAALPGAGGDVMHPALPDPPRPAFAVPTPEPLQVSSSEVSVASLRRATVARAKPSDTAPGVARVALLTPEGTTNVVLASQRAADADGRLWIRVTLPGDGTGERTGWVPRASLGGYTYVTTRLSIDLDEQTLVLTDDGTEVLRAPIGVGTVQNPTPRGEFYIRNKLTRYSGEFYGPVAFGTSAQSATLTDWPAGGFIGIHGTSQPNLIPGRISHGCVRLRNADILRLAELVQIGTPVSIR